MLSKFLIKVIFITAGILFLKNETYFSIILAAIGVISIFSPQTLKFLNKNIEKLLERVGRLLLNIIIVVIYILIVIPTKLFANNRTKSSESNFKSIERKSIDFERPW